MRIFSGIILLLFVSFTSCEFFSVSKEESRRNIDTIIDFEKVDISPSFKKCQSLDKRKKENCFRKEMQRQISKSLKTVEFHSTKDLSGVVSVRLIISNSGIVTLKEIQDRDGVFLVLPALDSLIRVSVKKIPKISPALKQGIPVKTEYVLPIHITLKENL